MESLLQIPLTDLETVPFDDQGACSTGFSQVDDCAYEASKQSGILAELVEAFGPTDLHGFQEVLQEGGQCHEWDTGDGSTFCSDVFWSAAASCPAC